MGNKKNKRQKITSNFDDVEKENLKILGKGSWFSHQSSSTSSCDISCENHSASFHKLSELSQQKCISEDDCEVPSAENYIVNMSNLQQNLDVMTVCSLCKEGILVIKEHRQMRQGLVPFLYVDCSNELCSVRDREFPIQNRSGRTYELNKRIVLGARASGGGETAVAKMFAFMGLSPPPTKNSWNNYQSELADDIECLAEEDMVRASSELKDLKRRLGEWSENDQYADVAVSFDGSWNHVGHSASFCVVFAISVDTGKIIDFEYKYKICKMCKSMEKKEGSVEYTQWKENHKQSCTKTHDGSSSSMESACIVDLYRRSVEKRGLRYTVLVGDGDSSSYRSVLKENIYGPEVTVVKENCVGHIQKRMGTKLRKLLQENKGKKLEDGKCLSGRGRLTQKVIDSFQVFYGIAIRANKGNLTEMQRAKRVIIEHYSATPDNPTHDLCPQGENTWCKFQSDKAQGTDTYRFPKNPLPFAVRKEIEPIITELSSETLLKTCQMGLTQNANEACHSILWRLVSKRQYNSESAYRLATSLTVGHWNSGQECFNCAVCEKLRVNVPDATLQTWRRLDRIRVRDAEYKNTPERKQRRKDIRKEALKMENTFQKMEGKTYDSGRYITALKDTVRRCKTCKMPMKGHKRNSCMNPEDPQVQALTEM